MPKEQTVAVLGAGVMGCSTAILLSGLGYKVKVYSSQRLTFENISQIPSFASAYPAASVIPHSVYDERIDRWFKDSTEFFNVFVRSESVPVGLQTHYEVFERQEDVSKPSAHSLNLRYLNSEWTAPIKRPEIDEAFGFSFRCHFCDMPFYAEWLDRRVDELGIEFVGTQITKSTITSFKEDVIVNCLGSRASAVFEDISPGFLIRGILLSCDKIEFDKEPFSYNYTPTADVYSDASSNPTDVYCYPRRADTILGGTREVGRVNQHGLFVPDIEWSTPKRRLGEQEFPSAIFDLNRELISQVSQSELRKPNRVLIGYRHVGGTPTHPSAVLKLSEQGKSPPRIDCFGFGGAGVTLSWGAAMNVARHVQEVLDGASVDNRSAEEIALSLI